ncbi:MAG: phosphatidylserine decarboxylase [Desulfovibrionales bacterium]
MATLQSAVIVLAAGAALLFGAYLFWRHFWFFRNPRRVPPEGEGILSPADGTVVYVKRVEPGDPVISIKGPRTLTVTDISGEDQDEPMVIIGVFMSPFDVHYNRAPLSGSVESIRHRPARLNLHMGSMHWRAIRRKFPIYENSPHILENERTVTRLRGRFKRDFVSCYLVQIAGGSVRGVDSYIPLGGLVERGNIFGMIRIGSQVDTIVTWKESMQIRVKPGDRVRAGETVLIE